MSMHLLQCGACLMVRGLTESQSVLRRLGLYPNRCGGCGAYYASLSQHKTNYDNHINERSSDDKQ